MTGSGETNIERRVAYLEEDGARGEDFAVVRVTENRFDIETIDGRLVFSAPLDMLVLQLCLSEPRLAQFLLDRSDSEA